VKDAATTAPVIPIQRLKEQIALFKKLPLCMSAKQLPEYAGRFNVGEWSRAVLGDPRFSDIVALIDVFVSTDQKSMSPNPRKSEEDRRLRALVHIGAHLLRRLDSGLVLMLFIGSERISGLACFLGTMAYHQGASKRLIHWLNRLSLCTGTDKIFEFLSSRPPSFYLLSLPKATRSGLDQDARRQTA